MRRFWIYLFFCFPYLTASIVEKPLVVLIPSYNNVKYANNNLTSVACQNYSNYRIIYVNDCSTDGTKEEVEILIKSLGLEKRTRIIHNQKRVGALENIYNAVHSCKDEEVILLLDGDDYFAHPDVLSRINNVYSSSNVWLTHGKYLEFPSGVSDWSIAIPDSITLSNSFRTFRCPTHLKTFYAWLFKKIKKEDLCIDGNFFQSTYDLAIMFPMLEMAGIRHKYIDEILYIYNFANPLNDFKVDRQLQKSLDEYIRSLPTYELLP